MDTPPTTVGPGIGAFIAFLVLAVVLWLLMRNMNGRMRRMAYREQQRVAEIEAQQVKEADRASQAGAQAKAAGPRRKGRNARRAAGSSTPAPEGGGDAQDTPEEPAP